MKIYNKQANKKNTLENENYNTMIIKNLKELVRSSWKNSKVFRHN